MLSKFRIVSRGSLLPSVTYRRHLQQIEMRAGCFSPATQDISLKGSKHLTGQMMPGAASPRCPTTPTICCALLRCC